MARVESSWERAGWWPPGEGEPGMDWGFAPKRLVLSWDGPGEAIDVLLPTPDGDRALASFAPEDVLTLIASVIGAGDG